VPVPGEGASPINFHTEKWDDFAEIPGTTDFWAKKLGIPFENTTPEIVGRLVGGLLGMAAPLIPGTKAFVRALKEIALTPSPVGPSTMRGSVGFGDNKNALADEASRMQRASMYDTDVYHGSTHDVPEFDGLLGNPESDWGRGTYKSTSVDDVNPNYAGEGPDLTGRIQQEAEQYADGIEDYDVADYFDELSDADDNFDPNFDPSNITEDQRQLAIYGLARNSLVGGNSGVVYPLKVNTSKYARVGGDNPTQIEMPDYRQQAIDEIDMGDYPDGMDYDEAVDEFAYDIENSDYDSPLISIRDALQDSSEYGGDPDAVDSVMNALYEYGGDFSATDLDSAIREYMIGGIDEAGDTIPAGAISAQVLERLGYEGVIDSGVSGKFGEGRQFGVGMEGVYSDTDHVVTFPGFEKNIRSKFAKFDPSKKDSANILAGTGGAAVIGAGARNNREDNRNSLRGM
jgi:hypothetical protein